MFESDRVEWNPQTVEIWEGPLAVNRELVALYWQIGRDILCQFQFDKISKS